MPGKCFLAVHHSPKHTREKESTITLRSIKLAVKTGSITKTVEFLVIDRPASYNDFISS